MTGALLKGPLIAAAVMLSGCAGVLAHKGAVIDQELVAAIQPGVDNKESVEKVLGRPTFTGQFNANDWYYVSRDTKQIAFRNPRPTRGTVLLVRFDQAGNVAAVSRTGRELMAGIDPTGRRTPTLGRERGFFEELFGNIGRVGSVGGNGQGGTSDNPQ